MNDKLRLKYTLIHILILCIYFIIVVNIEPYFPQTKIMKWIIFVALLLLYLIIDRTIRHFYKKEKTKKEMD